MTRLQRLLCRLSASYPIALGTAYIAGKERPWYSITDADAVVRDAIVAEQTTNGEISNLLQSKSVKTDPFWATDWPSAQVFEGNLDSLIKRHHLALYNTRGVLELGCGSGLVSVACGLRGVKVIGTDFSRHALLLASLNAVANDCVVPFRYLDWHDLKWGQSCFSMIVATDIVYDLANHAAIEKTLRHLLEIKGTALIAEPFRRSGDIFIDHLLVNGWSVDAEPLNQPTPNANSPVRLLTISRKS